MIFGENQQQKVESNSTAVQVGGDLSVTHNHGLSVSDVKELCILFLRDNFPALRNEAIRSAEENVQRFAEQLEERIVAKSATIMLEKFADPDVQAAINDAVQACARKGNNANPNLLVDLISERAAEKSNNFKDIVISEAVLVAPKITKEQISYLSFILFLTNFNVNGLVHISQLETFSSKVVQLVRPCFNISLPQKRHLEYAGTCSILTMMSIDIYSAWMTQLYKHLGYSDLTLFKSEIARFTPSTKILLDHFEQDIKAGQVSLTSVGQAIAIANLSTCLGRLDYTTWLI